MAESLRTSRPAMIFLARMSARYVRWPGRVPAGEHDNRKRPIQSGWIGRASWAASDPGILEERARASSEGAASQRNTWQVPREDLAQVAKVEPSGEKAA